MNRRLQSFLDAENISQSQLADMLQVARASVSHILNGRNKPSFEFINSMMNSFPRLNIEWLLNGRGKMYKESASPKEDTGSPDNSNLFDFEPVADVISPRESPDPVQSDVPDPKIEISEEIKPMQNTENQRKISKILVFYDDNTFQEIS